MAIPRSQNNKGEPGIGRPAVLFLLVWFVLNLLQVTFTELTSDEGYYWFYAQRLQWGYYDHPPLVAVLVRAGTVLFPGETGVRFFNVVLSTAGMYLFFRLLPPNLRNRKRTFLVLLGAPLLHYLAFFVFPDGPLLFFGLLFLVLYKRFLARQTLYISLLLGVSLALMAYAKYHGALVLLFTVAAHPVLLRQRLFYVSLLVAALLVAPHLWWQYQNHFPTMQYHLSGRTGGWSFRYVGEFLSQQILAIGPALIFLPFVIKTKNEFERTLKFIITGTLLFFFVSSFKTFVHFHWTSIALYPLLYFAVAYYNGPQKAGLFKVLVLPFVFLFFAARLFLAVPFIDNLHAGEDYYHGRKQWAADIKRIAGTRPLFMHDNLREVSLYRFYSGAQAVTLYARPEKKSQYELWGYEDSLQGKEVLFLTKYPHSGSTKIASMGRDFYWSVVPRFQSYYTRVAIKAVVNGASADSLLCTVRLVNNTAGPLKFDKGASLVYSLEQQKRVLKNEVVFSFTGADGLAPRSSITKQVSVAVRDVPRGAYRLYFGVRSGVFPDAIISNALSIAR